MTTAFPFPAHPRTPYPPLIVNAAVTGMVAQPERVPHVPLTAEQTVADAERCFTAGEALEVDGRAAFARRNEESPLARAGFQQSFGSPLGT